MRIRLLGMLLVLILCLATVAPAVAAPGTQGIFNDTLDGFLVHPAFNIQDVVSVDDLKGLREATESTRVSDVLMSPAKWSKGWFDGQPGSWLKAMVVWKTDRGLESYHFEVACDGDGAYRLVKSDLMIGHTKDVNRS